MDNSYSFQLEQMLKNAKKGLDPSNLLKKDDFNNTVKARKI